MSKAYFVWLAFSPQVLAFHKRTVFSVPLFATCEIVQINLLEWYLACLIGIALSVDVQNTFVIEFIILQNVAPISESNTLRSVSTSVVKITFCSLFSSELWFTKPSSDLYASVAIKKKIWINEYEVSKHPFNKYANPVKHFIQFQYWSINSPAHT